MPFPPTRAIVTSIVDQHVADLAILWNTRDDHVSAPHVALRHLNRLDDRLAANLDGCAVAGPTGMRRLLEQLADPGPAATFACTAVALVTGDLKSVGHCVTVAESLTECAKGVISAMGWVERDRLTDVVRDLLASQSQAQRRLGLAACRVQLVEPAAALTAALMEEDSKTRAEAFRITGTLGCLQHLPFVEMGHDDDPDAQFWSAWAAVMLGNRHRALDTLTRIALGDGPYAARAFQLSVQAMSVSQAHALLQDLRQDPERVRMLLKGSGISGNPAYVPWLISQMTDDKVSRVAGEAFSLITGADLALLDLERKPPDHVDAGPNDNPEDANVEGDEDDGLPWPDAVLINRWWQVHAHEFGQGTRSFMGGAVEHAHLIDVVKTGRQRQRILAAHHLCLLEPGTPLFNTAAPAGRQKRQLVAM